MVRKVWCIGDSEIDYMLSNKNNISFLYVSQFSEWKINKYYNEKIKFFKILNFKDISYE